MATENSNNQSSQPSKAEQDAAVKLKEAEAKLEAANKKLKDLEDKAAADKLKAEQDAAAKEAEDKAIAEKKEQDAKAAADAEKPLKLKHNDEKYEFPAGEKKNFIVRHSSKFTSPTGQVMEDPGSVRTQIYRPEVYFDLIHENEKTGEQNAFVQAGDTVIVLHDPTK